MHLYSVTFKETAQIPCYEVERYSLGKLFRAAKYFKYVRGKYRFIWNVLTHTRITNKSAIRLALKLQNKYERNKLN